MLRLFLDKQACLAALLAHLVVFFAPLRRNQFVGSVLSSVCCVWLFLALLQLGQLSRVDVHLTLFLVDDLLG